ncbi:MAG: beta-ketoacyl synthase N-terminal-like domain-containing protein, partial [Pseudomonadota bacterium]
ASRCAITPISEEFRARKLAMERAGASATEIREELETMSLGRLRMATKGLARTGETLELTRIDEDQRRAEGMYMIGQVAAMHDAVGSIAELHETVSAGSTALLRERAAPLAPARPAVPEPADVAIVGMATILPGAASLNAFWRRLVKGESAIREIPTDRWPLDWYFDEDRHARDRIYSRWGGFVDDVAFDPLKYGIPPAALASIDPMQLLSLELMSALVKDAGDIAQEPEDRARTSVIFGFSGGIGELGGHYAMRAELPMVAGAPTQDMLSRLPEWTEDSFAGLLPNVSAGRVANRFDLGGSNFAVDAACASSLTAVYSAVMELESGRADAVIAGGIDVTQAPFGYLCFSKTQALSPRGVCNTFDASADGIVISEGLAAVALKRLSDAERDGDRIYAVIKGVGASSDGRARGLTAPLPAGQRRALDRAYAQARYAPSDVDLFEAHGTGTVAGDKAELDTVTGALRACGAAPRTSAIGSVKTLIGHTKATAGVAGLIKVALGLHNRVLPPHANVSAPNAALEDADTPLYLEQSVRPWVSAPGRARRAGVSSFGFGGTNFHVTVEEYAGAEAGDGRAELGLECVPFGLAAETREALFAQVEAMLAAIDAGRVGTAVELADIAAGDGVVRAGFVATSLDEAAERLAGLRAFLRGEAEHPPKGVQFDDAPALLSGGKLAFLFPGQGSQHPSMLARAALLDPAMSSRLDEAEGVLAETPTFAASGRRLSSFLYPGDAFAADARKRQMTELTATEVAQPALGAVEGGLAAALMGLGAAPDMAAGHSYGEFVALHAAGVLSFDDLLRLSEARGRAMVENSDPAKPGAMAAVAADEATTRAALTEVGEVVIANLNSPRQTVIAGPQAAVEAAIPALEAAGLQVTRVPVSQAFHSPLMHAAKGQFEAALRDVAWGEASMPVYSNATGRRHAADPTAMRDAMAEHLISSVDFVAMIRAMFDDGARVFVEVGPKSVLTSRVSEILGEDAPRLIAVDRGPDGSAAFMDALVQLHVCGAAIDLAKLRSRLAQVEPAGLDGDPDRLWLVNGAYARKASAPPRTVSVPASVGDAALPGLETAVSTGAPGAAEATSAPGLAASPVPRLEFVAAPDEGAPVGDGPMNDASSILSDYHAMMRDFLRVQENVMMAYLGQAPSDRPAQAAPLQPAIPAAAAPAPLPLPTSPIVAPAPMPTPVAAAPPPAPPSPPPTEPAAAAPPADLLASFTGIVADKTGYPEDMLDPDQSMEADLGIDSIKRMELLGALQKILPDAAAGRLRDNMDEVSQLASIRAIVEFIGEGAEMAPPGAGATGQEAAARPFEPTGAGDMPATLPRFIQRPHIEPADHVTGDLPAGFPVLVTGASDGFHEDVARGLSKAGAAPTILPRAVLEAGGGALAEWLAEHWAGDGAAGLIHLETRTATPELGALDLDAWRASHEAGVKRLFELLQLAAPRLRAGGRVTVAMEAGGGFGRTARADGAAASPKDAGA